MEVTTTHSLSPPPPPLSPMPMVQRKVLSICDQASSYVMGGGVLSGVGAIFAAGIQYNSFWLAGLMGIPVIGCFMGYQYVRKYKKLKTINELSSLVGQDARRISETALSISKVADRTIEATHALSKEEEKMGIELNNLQAADEKRTQELDRLHSLIEFFQKTNEALQSENKQLKSETERLQSEMAILSHHMKRFKERNEEFFSSVQSMGVHLDQFKQEEKGLRDASNYLNQNVTQLVTNLDKAQSDYHLALQLLSEQNERLQDKIADLSLNIARLERVDRQLTPKLAESRQLAKRIEAANTKLENLQTRLSSHPKSVKSPSASSSPQNTPPPNSSALSPPPKESPPASSTSLPLPKESPPASSTSLPLPKESPPASSTSLPLPKESPPASSTSLPLPKEPST